jgi:hypothetical protein
MLYLRTERFLVQVVVNFLERRKKLRRDKTEKKRRSNAEANDTVWEEEGTYYIY